MQSVEDATFASKVKASAEPVAVVFYSEWCTTCKEMMPVLEEVAGELKGRLGFFQIDFDENTQSAVECGVLVVPTVVLLAGGKSLERIVGFQTAGKLRDRIKPHLPHTKPHMID